MSACEIFKFTSSYDESQSAGPTFTIARSMWYFHLHLQSRQQIGITCDPSDHASRLCMRARMFTSSRNFCSVLSRLGNRCHSPWAISYIKESSWSNWLLEVHCCEITVDRNYLDLKVSNVGKLTMQSKAPNAHNKKFFKSLYQSIRLDKLARD